MGIIWTIQSGQPSLSPTLTYGVAHFSLSLGSNIVLTILIVIRLLLYRRRLMESLPAQHSEHYMSLLTIIVESAALTCVFALLFLVTFIILDPVAHIFMVITSSVQVRRRFPL